MNTATNFVKNAVLKYGERYIDTGRFRPVVHVMWIIGVTGFVYEGYHHHKLEKLHTQKAEARKVELKEAHSAAVSALETHNGEIARTKEFITLSKSAITKAKGHIADLTVKQKLLVKAVEDSKSAYENYKPPAFGH